MNTLAANQSDFRLTDSIERDVIANSVERRPTHVVRSTLRAIAGAFNAFFSFVDEVNETMNQARQQSARITGLQW
jgi:hypothetical protein